MQDSLKKIFLEKVINEKIQKPLANYVPCKISKNSLYVSGQLPKDIMNENIILTEKNVCNISNKFFNIKSVSNIIKIEDIQYASIMCAIQILLVCKDCIGDLNNIKSCLQLQVFVKSDNGFTDQHLVANGASDFICNILGKDIGSHSRFAVGVSALPLNAIVEIGAIFEIEDN